MGFGRYVIIGVPISLMHNLHPIGELSSQAIGRSANAPRPGISVFQLQTGMRMMVKFNLPIKKSSAVTGHQWFD